MSLSAQTSESLNEKTSDIGIIGSQAYEHKMEIDHGVAVKIAGDARLNAAIKQGDPRAVKSLVDEYSKSYDFLNIITVVDKNSITLARSASGENGDRNSNSLLTKALAGNEFTSTELLPASTIQNNNLQSMVNPTGLSEGMAIVSAVPVKDENNNIIGALYVAEILNSDPHIVDDVSSEGNGFCSVFQGDTRIATSIKDGSGTRVLGSRADPGMATQVLQDGKSVSDSIIVEGKPLSVYYEPLKNSDGKIVGMLATGYDMGPSMARLNNMIMISVLIGLVIAVLAVVVGLLVVRRITTPIHRLVGAADSIAAGNLDTPIHTGASNSEIEALSDSIKRMVSNIKDRVMFNESILKGITDPLYVVDSNAHITYVNETGAKFLGSSASDLVGRRFGDSFKILDSTSGESQLARCLRTGETASGFEVHAQLQDGRKLYVRGSNAPIKDASGRITGAVELLQDMTREKEAQEEIKKSQKDTMEKAAFSQSVLNSIRDIHFVVDAKGTIEYMNTEAQAVLGNALGHNLREIAHLKAGSSLDALTGSKDILGWENLLITGNREIPVLINAVLMKDSAGKTSGLSIIMRDITEQKKAEENLQKIIRTANEVAEKMAVAAQQASSATGQAMTSSRQISESISQIAIGSQSQAKEVENISGLIKGISSDAEKASSGARSASALLGDASSAAKDVDVAAKQALSKMSDINVTVNDSARIIRDLGDKSKQIGKIVEVITSIASQTNLLALNAAIEAARAGEAGRGFAVVAEEVRKLAEDSAKSTEQISNLISQIREQTDRAVVSMDKGTSEVASGSEVVGNALKSVDKITRLVDQVADVALNVSSATEKQVKDTLEIAKAIEQISAVVEESASATEEVSASAEESTATMEETAGIAQQVLKMAEELKREVNKLKA
ncbi:methyl-accepting chemotaxis protein [Methanocella sp. MCL-LM]|uniref:methyl-accepting chemotaxis protein n=1 Tax=Methanocella sp. MCL-LM TaxID=3412035 RepID=UPI003C768586